MSEVWQLHRKCEVLLLDSELRFLPRVVIHCLQRNDRCGARYV
jgi:hypothetical protein